MKVASVAAGAQTAPVNAMRSSARAQTVQPLLGSRARKLASRTNKSSALTLHAQSSQSINVAAAEAPAALTLDWETIGKDLDLKSPLEIMDHALATFGTDIGIAFSGAEDVALIEYAHLTGRPYRVFSLDTGRLNPETYQLFDAVEKHYNIRIEYTFPDAEETMELVRTKGMFSFYEDGHGECCRVRKVRPLRRQLTGLRAWITGQRKDQSPGTRQAVPVVQVDPVFEGVDGGAGSLVKYNPLSNVSSAEVWNFLRVMDVPVNKLHACGYISIGCEPCTRAVLPNQHEREGRWWWEDATAKECGLHSGNIIQSAEGQAAAEKNAPDLYTSSAVETLSKDRLQSLLGAGGNGGARDRDTLVVLYAPWCQFCQALEPAWNELAEQFANAGSSLRVAKFQADIEREFAAEKFGLKTFPTIVLLPKRGGDASFVKYPSERRDVETLTMWVRTLIGYE